MPGFVDVSNMSDLEIKRLGQADEDDIDFQPRRRVASTVEAASTSTASTKFSVSDVWAAACAADRVNGGYFKEFVFQQVIGQPPKLIKRKNRDIMMEFLANPDQLLVEDVERGEQVRNFLQNDLTFRTVKGKLNEFDNAVSKCLVVKDYFDSFNHKYELAVVASLPASAARTEARQNVEQRIKFARGGYVGTIGEKVQLNAEVLSVTRSKEFNIYWIRCITDQDQIIVFSNKESFDAGTHFTVQGKVKAHRDDNLTQLNYVKVL